MFENYEDVKSRLVVELVGISRNQELLSECVHTVVEDMAEVYKIILEDKDDRRATARITDEVLDVWGVSLDELRQDAYESTRRRSPELVIPMSELFGIPFQAVEGDSPEVYIVTTEDQFKGACALFYPDVVDALSERVGGDYFVLPSSIHETLLISDVNGLMPEELKALVTIVNHEEVKLIDQLTDSVYHYDSKSHVFELAEKFEERKKLEVEQEKAEKKRRKSRGR